MITANRLHTGNAFSQINWCYLAGFIAALRLVLNKSRICAEKLSTAKKMVALGDHFHYYKN